MRYPSRQTSLKSIAALGLAAALMTTPLHAADDQSTAAGRAETSTWQTVQVDGREAPPVELIMGIEGGSTTCEPAELLVPGNSVIDLRITNRGNQQITIGSPDLFSKGHLVRFEGGVGHAASELGFVVKASNKARIVVRTPAEGTYTYTCADVGDQGRPFKGQLTVGPSAR